MSETHTILFLQTTETKRIKIGQTKKTPEEAITAWQKELSEEIVLLKAIVGTPVLAKSLKEEFKALRVENLIWFNPHPELLARIDSIEDHDGKSPLPPKPETKYRDKPEITCCYCNTSDEVQIMQGGRRGFLTTNDNHRDWGKVAYGWAGTNKLCWKCAHNGGFTNDIFEVFRDNRKWLHPFWQKKDEKFLTQCDVEVSDTAILYVWEKAQMFTTEILGIFLTKNPLGDLNETKHFLLAYLNEVVEENMCST